MKKGRQKRLTSESGSIAYIMAAGLLALGLLGAQLLNTDTFRRLITEQDMINSRASQAVVAKGFNVWNVLETGVKDFDESRMEDEVWRARKILMEQRHSNPDETCYDVVFAFYGVLAPIPSMTCDPDDGVKSLLEYEDRTNAYCQTHSTPVQCYQAAEQALAEDPTKCFDYFLCQFNDETETWSAVPMHLQF